MKKDEVAVGKTYAMKVSGRISPVTITSEAESPELRSKTFGYERVIRRASTYWRGRNESTGREVFIRSAQKLRFEVEKAASGKWQRRLTDAELLKTVAWG